MSAEFENKNIKRRFENLQRVVSKVKDVEEEMNVRDKRTKKYIKEKVNRKQLAEQVLNFYKDRKITQSDKIERLIQDLIKVKTKTPIRRIKKIINDANTGRFRIKVLFYKETTGKSEDETDEQFKKKGKV
jgi:hypothetical protein